VRSPQRDELHKHLKAASIDTGIHYPTPLHLQPAYDRLSHRPGDFPIAEAAAREVLSLPMYAELSPTQMEKIVAAVEAFAANR
jgi:dTDP-4-amino-4,6-dideoxygalactose transaminase